MSLNMRFASFALTFFCVSLCGDIFASENQTAKTPEVIGYDPKGRLLFFVHIEFGGESVRII